MKRTKSSESSIFNEKNVCLTYFTLLTQMPSVLSVFDNWTITVQPCLYYFLILPNQGSFYLQEVEYSQQMTYSLPIDHVYFASNCSQRINVCTVTLDWSKALCRPSSFLPPGTQASLGGKPQTHIFLYWRRTTTAHNVMGFEKFYQNEVLFHN